jgi:hypothetical protein
MRRPKTKPQKKRGRPATGKHPMIGFRSPPTLTRRIDNWAKQQADKPPRAEAIRRLLTMGLDSVVIDTRDATSDDD